MWPFFYQGGHFFWGRGVCPLGLLVRGDRAVKTIPTTMIESPSAWISSTNKALQAEVTRYTSRSSYSLVLQGVQGFSSSSPSH